MASAFSKHTHTSFHPRHTPATTPGQTWTLQEVSSGCCFSFFKERAFGLLAWVCWDNRARQIRLKLLCKTRCDFGKTHALIKYQGSEGVAERGEGDSGARLTGAQSQPVFSSWVMDAEPGTLLNSLSPLLHLQWDDEGIHLTGLLGAFDALLRSEHWVLVCPSLREIPHPASSSGGSVLFALTRGILSFLCFPGAGKTEHLWVHRQGGSLSDPSGGSVVGR